MNTDLFLAEFGHLATSQNGIQKLRGLILDLAVRGQLVPQDQNDEPASMLLKRIEAEKQHLIEVGNLKPQKPLPPITEDEIPYELPQGWMWVRLGEITNTIQTGPFGSNLHQEEYIFGGIPIVNPSNMVNGKIVPEDKWTVDQKTFERLSNYALTEGDLVIARRGEMGRCAIVTENEGGWLCGTGSLILRTSSYIYRPYLWLFFQTEQARSYLIGGSVGATMNNLSQKILLNMPFPLPSIAAKQRIIAKVDELMSLCDQLEAELDYQRQLHEQTSKSLLYHLTSAVQPQEAYTYWEYTEQYFADLFDRASTVEELRATILQLAVQGRLVPQDPNEEPASILLERIEAEKQRLIEAGELKPQKPLPPITEDEIPYELPQGWAWVRLEYLCKQITDGEHFRPQTVDRGVFFLSAKDVRSHGVVFDDPLYVAQEDAERFWQRCNPERDDILVVSRGATVGRSCIVDSDVKFCLLGSVILIKPSVLVDSKYSLYALKSPDAFQQLISLSGATAQPAIYIRDIRKAAIPIPPLLEQQRIVAKVDELMALCDQLETEAEHSHTLSARLLDSLVHHMFADTE